MRKKLVLPSQFIKFFVFLTLLFFSFSCAQFRMPILRAPQFIPPDTKYVEKVAQGETFPLSTGELFIPDYFKPSPEINKVNVFVHFHGPMWLSKEHFYYAHPENSIHINISFQGLSGVYSKPFSDETLFQKILDEALEKTKEKFGLKELTIDKIFLTSFSAGFGAVKEILKKEEYYDKIEALIMADSIYAGYVDEEKLRVADAVDMKDFLRFAQESAIGKKTMFVSHSYIDTKTYASTVDTANFLIAGIGEKRKKVREYNSRGMKLISRCDKGNFFVRGYEGDTAQMHMAHLYAIGEFLKFILQNNQPKL